MEAGMRRLSWRSLFFVLNLIGLSILIWRVGIPSSQKLLVMQLSPEPEGVCRPEEVSQVSFEFGGALDPRTIKADAIRLLPNIPGTVSLDGERTLRFLLLKKMAWATRYQVELSSQVRGRGGEKPQQSRFFFFTPSLAVKEVSQAKIEADRASVLAITFNSAVSPQALTNHLELSDPQGHSISFTPVGSRPDAQVQVRIPKTEWDELKLTIRKGLTGTEGPLPLRDDYQAAVKVAASLQFAGLKVKMEGDAEGSTVNAIEVQMNSPVDAESAGQFIKIDPAVKYTLEPSDKGLSIIGEFKPAHRYTVTMKTGLSGGAAGALVQDITRSVWFPDREPSARFPYGDGVLSTHGLLTTPIRSVNIKAIDLSIYRLYANNLVEYALRQNEDRFDSLGVPLNHTEIQLENRKNEDVETLLRLNQFVKGDAIGVYSLQLTAKENSWNRDCAILVVTDLGLSVRRAKDQALVWVTSLSSGRPVSGCNVTLYSDRRQNMGMAITDADGVARIAIPPTPEGEKPALVVAANTNDLNYLDISENGRDRGPETAEGRAYLKRGYEVFSFAERGVYRPGDTVQLSGLVRNAELTQPEPMPVNLVVKNPKDRVFLRKTVMSDAVGRVLASVPISVSSLSGQYQVSWHLPSKEEALGSTTFQVADYIPQTLRLAVTSPEGRQPGDKGLHVNVHAEHLFGGPAVGLAAKCRYRFRTVEFQPKGWENFIFCGNGLNHPVGDVIWLPDKKLDGQGNTSFTVEPQTTPGSAPVQVEAEVETLEPGGRAITEYLTRAMDFLPFYLGVKIPGDQIQAGKPVALTLAAVLPDGSANKIEATVKARLLRVSYSNVLRKQNGRLVYDWTRRETLESSVEVKLQDGRAVVSIKPERPGPYRLAVETEMGCPVMYDFQAEGPGTGWVSDDPEKVVMTLDKPAYRPGEMARLHIRAPFGGMALVTVEANQVLEYRLLNFPKGEGFETFNIKEEWRPNAYLTITMIRPVQPEKDWRPHRASGVIRLKVDCADRKLELKVESSDQVRQGRKMEVAVRVLSAGQPQPNTAVMLVAVDEGVLALTRYATPSPWDFFYPLRRLDIQEYDIFSRLAPELAEWKVGRKLNPGGGGGDEQDLGADLGRRLNPIQARRVKTAVIFAGTLVTNEQGIAKSDFVIPEFIGELRIMAVAARENRFGSAQKPLKVKNPIMAQASWPRFLAPNDVFQVPMTIFNRTGKDQEVKVEITFQGPLQVMEKLPLTVKVSKDSEKLLNVSMKAVGSGKVTARITVRAGEEQYTESVEIPVRPAAAFDRKSGFVTIEAGKPQRFTLDGKFIGDTAKTSVVIAGNRVVEVSGLLRYLLTYPYGCVEQTTSKLVPLIYLDDLARLAEPDAVGKEEIEEIFSAGILRYQMMQTCSGGLAMWPGETDPYPWGSLYAADLLVEAKKAGYDVPEKLLDPLLGYIKEQIKGWATARENYKPILIGETAYACYVLARAGEPPYTWMSTLEETFRDCDVKKIEIPATARFHLAAAYLASGQGKVGKEFIAASFPAVAKRQIAGYLDSPLRENAIKLLVLLDIDPESPQIPGLMETLRRSLGTGSVNTTQDAAFSLMALGKYARRIASESDGEVSVKLPDGSIKKFKARDGWCFGELKPGQALEINFQGRGKIYAFWYAEGVPAEGPVKEEDSGFAVRRTFYSIDGKKPLGSAPFRQGGLYQVALEITSKNTLDNLVITDLLPAGLEIADMGLKDTGSLSSLKSTTSMTINHVEPRDDRILIFAGAGQGKYEYRYVVRAVTAGEFTLPAVEAACMYDPGFYSVNGRGSVRVTP
jgi:alpha-2-macroglobulin